MLVVLHDEAEKRHAQALLRITADDGVGARVEPGPGGGDGEVLEMWESRQPGTE